MRDWLVGDALEQKVGPQRRADEVHVVDDDRVGVEQGDAVCGALLGELLAGTVDVGVVELVVPGDVQGCVRRRPIPRPRSAPRLCRLEQDRLRTR